MLLTLVLLGTVSVVLRLVTLLMTDGYGTRPGPRSRPVDVPTLPPSLRLGV